eukprot:11987014-Prorocentrum_lima.AAC.1
MSLLPSVDPGMISPYWVIAPFVIAPPANFKVTGCPFFSFYDLTPPIRVVWSDDLVCTSIHQYPSHKWNTSK